MKYKININETVCKKYLFTVQWFIRSLSNLEGEYPGNRSSKQGQPKRAELKVKSQTNEIPLQNDAVAASPPSQILPPAGSVAEAEAVSNILGIFIFADVLSEWRLATVTSCSTKYFCPR